DDLAGMRRAARALAGVGPCPVLVKGGHLEGESAVDVLYDGEGFTEYASRRIATDNTHGTGCTYSAAIAPRLARAGALHEAVDEARTYLTGALAASATWRLGKGPGPADHLWWLDHRDPHRQRTRSAT